MTSIRDKILRKIKRLGPGAVFTPKDFLDVASRGMVDMTLKQMVEEGAFRRLARGLYDHPKVSNLLNTPLTPDVDTVAQALSRRFRWRIVPSGAQAANMLGLSTQVPAKAVYLSDGPSKAVKLGKRELIFKHARPKDLGAGDPLASIVIQALRYLGKAEVNRDTIQVLRRQLSKPARQTLLRDTRYASDWIYLVAKAVAENGRS
jgi:hypothetical protein